MHASGLHRDMFSSVYQFCIDRPIKSSVLCDPINKYVKHKYIYFVDYSLIVSVNIN